MYGVGRFTFLTSQGLRLGKLLMAQACSWTLGRELAGSWETGHGGQADSLFLWLARSLIYLSVVCPVHTCVGNAGDMAAHEYCLS